MKLKVAILSASIVTALALLASDAAMAAPVEFKGSTFQEKEGEMILLGVGNRYKVGGLVNVYNAGFYVNQAKMEDALAKYLEKKPEAFASMMGADGKPDWEKVRNSGAFNTIIWKYGFPKKLIMKFMYNVPGDKIVEAYTDSLGKTLKDFEAPEVKADLEKFFAAVDHDVKVGQVMVVSSNGDTVNVAHPTETVKIENNWKFRQAMWRVWFGPSPIQEPLKKNLTQFASKLTWPK